MFVINPPHTLQVALQASLPQMVNFLGQDQHATFSVESGG
jgi:23S rRNA (adenine2030-N6)-methyltransferase